MPDPPLLRLVGIAKSFGAMQALRGIDLVVEEGQVVCIVGPSGCGKSTLLRCINFLEEPDEGYVYIDGEPMGIRTVNGRRRRDREANINRMRSRIGMVFQQFNVWPHLSVLDNVVTPQLCVAHRTRPEAERGAREQLERVGLGDKIGSFPAELSGGQLQRVAIARALAMDRSSYCSMSRPRHSIPSWSRRYWRWCGTRRRAPDHDRGHARASLCGADFRPRHLHE